jgi:hypothetical protein
MNPAAAWVPGLGPLLAGLTVLHADKDFEVIAQITGQPVDPLAAQ